MVLGDPSDFAGMNEEWVKWFPVDPPTPGSVGSPPATTTCCASCWSGMGAESTSVALVRVSTSSTSWTAFGSWLKSMDASSFAVSVIVAETAGRDAGADRVRAVVIGRIEDQDQAVVGAWPFRWIGVGEGERRARLGRLHHGQQVLRDQGGIDADSDKQGHGR